MSLRGSGYEWIKGRLAERKRTKAMEKQMEMAAFKAEKERMARERGVSMAREAAEKGKTRAREGGLAKRTLRKVGQAEVKLAKQAGEYVVKEFGKQKKAAKAKPRKETGGLFGSGGLFAPPSGSLLFDTGNNRKRKKSIFEM
jgi:hypothetical protein